MKTNEFALPFLEPVTEVVAPGYFSIIETPMDLSSIERHLQQGKYDENSLSFVEDFNLVWKNCIKYNDPASMIATWAISLSKRFKELMNSLLEKFDLKVSLRKKISNAIEGNYIEDTMNVNEQNKQRRKSKSKSSSITSVASLIRKIVDQLKVDESEPFLQRLQALGLKMESYIITPTLFIQDLTLVYEETSSTSVLKEKAISLVDDVFPKDEAGNNCFPLEHNGKLEYLSQSKYSETLTNMNIDLKEYASQFQEYFTTNATTNATPYPSGHSLKKAKRDANAVVAHLLQLSEIESSNQPIRNLEDLNMTIATYESDSAVKSQYIRSLALARYSQLNTPTPWMLQPWLFEIQNMGNVNSSELYHNESVIYPVGYKSTRLIHVKIVPCDESVTPLTSDCLIPIAITSTVLPATYSPFPRFCLTIDGGTIISEATTPKQAWQQLLESSQIEKMLKVRCSRLMNCHSVLNRMVVEPFAKHLIDFQASSITNGVNYNLRLVHKRLIDGFYDTEMEFAFDVRHVCSLAQGDYESNESNDLLLQTKLFIEKFEYLFSLWVLNYQHRSCDDLAKGIWEKWQECGVWDEITNIGPNMFTCSNCQTPSPLAVEEGSNKEVCPRCIKALEEPPTPPFENLSTNPNNRYNPSYTREEVGLMTVIPNPYKGCVGWFQAYKHRRGGLRNIFLSPLGYIVRSLKEDNDFLTQHNKFEAGIIKEILEVDSNVATRRTLQSSDSNPLHASFHGWTRSRYCCNSEEYQKQVLPLGRLVNYSLPTGMCILYIYFHSFMSLVS